MDNHLKLFGFVPTTVGGQKCYNYGHVQGKKARQCGVGFDPFPCPNRRETEPFQGLCDHLSRGVGTDLFIRAAVHFSDV